MTYRHETAPLVVSPRQPITLGVHESVQPDELMLLIEGIAVHILSTTDTKRSDRLWPAHDRVFVTNPLSLAYGACGIASWLNTVFGAIPNEVRSWIASQRVSESDYPPGLLVGAAGIACVLWELGLQEHAELAMASTYRSPLLFVDYTLFEGIAGWGTASLYFYRQTGRQKYVDAAEQAADALLRNAKEAPEGSFWQRAQGAEIEYGYGYGAAGASLFLLRAGKVLNRPELLELARRAFAYDLSHRVETNWGWGWMDHAGAYRQLPYWKHGAAGIGMVAVRLYQQLGDQFYLMVADKIAESVAVQWTALPAQLNGMSGIGDFLLDMYFVTRRSHYREAARELARSVSVFAVARNDGIAFPGRWSNRLSNDYGTGSAGVGAFLFRLAQNDPTPKLLVDL